MFTVYLTFTTVWTNSVDYKLIFSFIVFFPEIWHYMQTISKGDSLQEKMSSAEIFT